jgi:type II secretory pathway pseudopilin PulG
MSAGNAGFSAPLLRGAASGFCERPPSQGVEKQKGFTYVGFLIFVAITGAGLAAFGEFASHAAQREKEAELLFRGNAFRAAIASYYKKENRYPQSLEQLLEDKRYPMPVRHLRRQYVDPMTGEASWGLVEAPGGGVMGVYSRSEDPPIKTGNFLLKNQEFEEAKRYADWKFVHSPPGLGKAVEKSAAK